MKSGTGFSTRLEELYTILSEAENRSLGRYLASPYFNRDKSLGDFHLFLSKEQAGEGRYNKHRAWQAVFGKKTFNEKKFRYMVSDLAAGIEAFIYTEKIMQHKPRYVQLVDDYYNQREAQRNRAALATKIRNGSKSRNAVVNPAHYLEQHFENELLEQMETANLKAYNKNVLGKRTATAGGLDAYYIIEKLRQMCLVANDNRIFGTAHSCFYQNEVMHLAAAKEFAGNFIIAAYRCVFELLTQKKDASYYLLKNTISKNGYELEDTNLAELFVYARNFCIGKVNAGKTGFFEELFELYLEGLNKNILVLNGQINQVHYKNIVTTALRTGKHEWTFGFINDYHYSLPKAARDNAYNYNLANYYFHTGKYAEALRHLQKVKLADLFYGLDARSMMIKCYYELGEEEAFMNAYTSFRVFVQRRKNVSETHRRNYINFLRIAKKLVNIRPRNKNAVQKIADEIQNAKAIADKNWLQEKVKVYL